MGEKYVGCYRDSGKRDLPRLLREGYGNYKACFEAGTMKGFKYVGLQYSGECWAGNAYGKYGKRHDIECNMACKKDKGRKCGAGWRNSIFNIQKVDVSKHISIERFVKYEERMVILAYVQW